jgi:catechol 2,3-dioxygenase-like lactoylglutathione lyase family enzyme
MIPIEDIHHIRFRVPDLTPVERFMTDFGLTVAARDERRLYLRGSGPAPYCYIAELGETPEMVAMAFKVGSPDMLRAAEEIPSATKMSAIDAPGGGSVVTLRDPDGLRIDLVAGVADIPPLPVRPPLVLNAGSVKSRLGERQAQPAPGPAQVLRLGHAGLIVSDLGRSFDWYTGNFGLIPSDVIYIGEPSRRIGTFLRCDRGDEWVDHHSLVMFAGRDGAGRFHHASFEAQDSEAQQLGHRWMLSRRWEPYWGIGRHALGSHVFDFFRDPYGFRMENFTDTDLCRRDTPTGYHPLNDEELLRWGPPTPKDIAQ